jgi:predicted amidophosphoribosyltransferase
MNSERALGAALNLLFPTDIYCAACGNYIDGTRPYALCDVCVREIAWHTGATCAVCGKALAPHRRGGVCRDCREWGRSFDAGISCCAYTGRARDLVRAMKYKDSAWIAAKLADVMYDRWRQLAQADPSVVIPVPMTEAKRRTRGYDQAEVIARRLARLIGAPFANDILKRKRDTTVMSALGMAERRANMADAFEVDPYAAARGEEQASTRAPAPEQKQTADGTLLADVLLIDDVFTTGSTADACASTLKEAGVKRVTLFTFAAGADTDPRA